MADRKTILRNIPKAQQAVQLGDFIFAKEQLIQAGCEKVIYDPNLRVCAMCMMWKVCTQVSINTLHKAEPKLRERYYPGTGTHTVGEEWDKIIQQGLASEEKILAQNFDWDAPDIRTQISNYLSTHDEKIIDEIIYQFGS